MDEETVRLITRIHCINLGSFPWDNNLIPLGKGHSLSIKSSLPLHFLLITFSLYSQGTFSVPPPLPFHSYQLMTEERKHPKTLIRILREPGSEERRNTNYNFRSWAYSIHIWDCNKRNKTPIFYGLLISICISLRFLFIISISLQP